MQTIEDYLAPFAGALNKAADHARAAYPAESCGLVIGGRYIACENAALPAEQHTGEDGCGCCLCSFSIKDEVYLQHSGKIQMVVHSHPNGPAHPSKADMESQMATDVAWAIIPLDENRIGKTVVWGGDCPMAPVIGREFVHGIWDCYSAIRDVFKLGKDALEAQGIEGWPYAPVDLPVYPRDDQWWTDGESNFYEEKPQEIGFIEVSREDVRPGDVFLCRVHSSRLNHGGVLLGNNLILHHLPRRLSRREAAGIWAHSAEKWIRLKGAPLA